MINTDKIKSYLILKNQRHQRSICRKICISLMLLLTVAWVNAGFDGSASLTTRIDSLKQVIATAKHDTTRINALNDLAWELMYQNPDTSLLLGKQALYILTEFMNEKKTNQSLTLNKLISNTHSDLGVFYWIKGDYPKSLSHHHKALEIRKKLNNKPGIAASLSNIGLVYFEHGDYTNSLKHYKEALEINKDLKNKLNFAANLSNIGLVYVKYGNLITQDTLRHAYYFKALKHYMEALEINKELGNKGHIAKCLGNIGNIYGYQNNYTNAIKYFKEALELDKEQGNKRGIAIRFGNIGSLHTTFGNFDDAEAYLDSALNIDKEIGGLDGQMHWYQALSHLYDTLGQIAYAAGNTTASAIKFQLAYTHYKKYSAAKDSLFNEEKSKQIGRLEQQHEFEMAEIVRKQKEEMVVAAIAAATTRRNLLQYSAITIGIFLFFGFILLMGKFNVPVWVVELSVFMLFLLIFEFTLVLLDPTIDAWTGGAPAYKLLLNALLAGLIFPVHGLCEGLLKKKIMERR